MERNVALTVEFAFLAVSLSNGIKKEGAKEEVNEEAEKPIQIDYSQWKHFWGAVFLLPYAHERYCHVRRFVARLGTLIYLLVAFTPLKAYVIPDFTDYSYREDARKARIEVDSLLGVVRGQERFMADLHTVLNGGELSNKADTGQKQVSNVDLNYAVTEVDSAMRQRLSEQDRFQLAVDDETKATKKGFLLFKPVNGTISGKFDPKLGHFGIDLVAPKDDP